VRGPLQKYEDVLPKDFIRASRHVIINVRKVQRLRRVSRDLGIVYFAGEVEQTIRLGRKASIAMRTALLTRSGLPTTRGGGSSTIPGTTPDAPID
jgi:DNA-binding LytR/AlgR family response regulator